MDPSTNPQKLETREKERLSLELRKAGYSFTEIADQVGYANASGAYKAVQRTLQRMNEEISEKGQEVARLELTRLNSMIQGLWMRAKQGDIHAVDRVLKCIRLRMEICGMPTVIQVRSDMDSTPAEDYELDDSETASILEGLADLGLLSSGEETEAVEEPAEAPSHVIHPS